MKALIIGAAVSGAACARLLNKKGYEVYLTDAKAIDDKESLVLEGIKVYDNGHPDLLKTIDYDLIVKNPGIKYDVPFVKYFVDKGYHLLNEIEVAFRYAKNYTYASITGTNGKTTTTTLLGEMLKTQNPLNGVAGNIGYPLSEIVMKYEKQPLKIAMEISAFQLVACESYHPLVSVCTNLSPDHIDYFKDVDKYYKAKMLVYKNQRDDDWFLLNLDDENIIKYAKGIKCRTVTYSLNKKADLMVDGNWVTIFGKPLFKISDLKIVGEHNLSNAMVAAVMAYKMGVAISDIQRVLKEFKGVKHRLEFIKEIDGVRYYNDSKGTNPDSTSVALKAFDDNVILLAGGYDKHTGFESIRPYLHHVKKMLVFGQTAMELKELYPQAIIFENMEEALRYAKTIALKGDVVLLSPMCASWDQFKNFEERGDLFAAIVKQF